MGPFGRGFGVLRAGRVFVLKGSLEGTEARVAWLCALLCRWIATRACIVPGLWWLRGRLCEVCFLLPAVGVCLLPAGCIVW